MRFVRPLVFPLASSRPVSAAFAFVAATLVMASAPAAPVTQPVNFTLTPSSGGIGGASGEHVIPLTVGGSLYELAVVVQRQTGISPPSFYAKTVTWRTGTGTAVGRSIEAVPVSLGGGDAAALGVGDVVSSASSFSATASLLVRQTAAGSLGVWASGVRSALGLRFSDGGDSYYGYLLATIGDLDSSNVGPTAVLDAVVYESSPGAAISVVPEPTAAALLALGIPGVFSVRRRASGH